MSRRSKLYKVTRKGDVFTARFGFDLKPPILFSKEGIKGLKQYGYALMTTEKNGTHSLYLPTYKSGRENYIDTTIPAIEAISGIDRYQYFNGTFLLIKENHCMFIKVDSYIWYLGNKGIAEGRRNNLQWFYFSQTAHNTAHIREDVGILRDMTICNVDGIDYVIRHISGSVFGTDSQVKLVQFGNVTPLPGNTESFKISNGKGEFIHQSFYYQDENPEIYAAVVPFSKEDYTSMPEILSINKKSYGYWCKDADGNIVRIQIFTENTSFATYDIAFSEPVLSIDFLKRVRFSKDFYLDMWKVKCTKGNKEKYLLKCEKGTSLVSKEELL